MAGDYDEKRQRARKCLHKLCFAGLKAKDRSLRQRLQGNMQALPKAAIF